MKQSYYRRNADDAVSPVVGVMLMLVVTIIIAAVVSAFAGGLASEQKKTPTATMDITIANKGFYYLNGMNFKVNAVSEPIETKDVKIITSWTANDGTKGGATIMPWTPDTTPNVYISHSSGSPYSWHAPAGYGGQINWSLSSSVLNKDQYWGNYTLAPGIASQSQSFYSGNGGYGGYGYSTSWPHYYEYTNYPGQWDNTTDTDAAMAVLGKEWYHLRQGDVVKVKFIYIPTGGTIFEKDVAVTSR
ncbi:MAG: type IV pilin N-terminal domain-containing protein [Methanoregula sp.]|nr:type IV pilin N-terminal domain-containing protein [Methanoregula sp.]